MSNLIYRVATLYLAIASPAFLVFAQVGSDYDALVQKGNVQLQAAHADLALATGEQAIKTDATRWEGYALAGGALMNLKQYEKAADMFSHAIDRAPEAKQATLRDLRKQCLLAEAGASTSAPAEMGTTTQAEIVLWKSIESSTNPADFQGYLTQYPHGAFAVLANQHLADLKAQTEKAQEELRVQAEQERQKEIAEQTWIDPTTGLMWSKKEVFNPNNVKHHEARGLDGATRYCAESRLLGYADWRLPTAPELLHIYHNGSTWKRPKIDGGVGAGNLNYIFWTSSPGTEAGTHIVVVYGKPHENHDRSDLARIGIANFLVTAVCVRNSTGDTTSAQVSKQ